MRPRHVAILFVLAAVPVGLAVLITSGSGSSNSAAGVPSVQISLNVAGGGSAAALTACGSAHHYATYAHGTTIRFHGTLSRAGSWSIKVKLKACVGGLFQDSGQAGAQVQPNGSFSGSFPAPIAGEYFARAEARSGGVLAGRSEKQYFAVH